MVYEEENDEEKMRDEERELNGAKYDKKKRTVKLIWTGNEETERGGRRNGKNS